MRRRIKEEDLVVGTLYKVSFDDCCVGGEFTSKFTGETEDGTEFENGVVLFATHACIFEEIETEDNPIF